MMKCYLINLDRAPERLKRMTELLEKHDVQFERIAAVDGKTQNYEAVDPNQLTPSGRPALAHGDIACGASHMICLQRIASGDAAYGVVIEDDLHLAADVSFYLNSMDWIPDGADIIKLETFAQSTLLGRKVKNLPNKRSVAPLLRGHWGAALYVIRKEAAQRILREYNNKIEYIDVYLFQTLLGSFNIYQINPALAVQDNISGFDADQCLLSDIAPQRSVGQLIKPKGYAKFRRELLRIFRRGGAFCKAAWLAVYKGQSLGKVRYRA